jgi:hypothetical protein
VNGIQPNWWVPKPMLLKGELGHGSFRFLSDVPVDYRF